MQAQGAGQAGAWQLLHLLQLLQLLLPQEPQALLLQLPQLDLPQEPQALLAPLEPLVLLVRRAAGLLRLLVRPHPSEGDAVEACNSTPNTTPNDALIRRARPKIA